MSLSCTECGKELSVPEDSVQDEVISCPDCGMDYIVKKTKKGIVLRDLTIVGEDWGE